jgi:hypothetical protein
MLEMEKFVSTSSSCIRESGSITQWGTLSVLNSVNATSWTRGHESVTGILKLVRCMPTFALYLLIRHSLPAMESAIQETLICGLMKIHEEQ